jgi:hypothetical protein
MTGAILRAVGTTTVTAHAYTLVELVFLYKVNAQNYRSLRDSEIYANEASAFCVPSQETVCCGTAAQFRDKDATDRAQHDLVGECRSDKGD